MGVALQWQWFAWLFGSSKARAQAISYLISPLVALATVGLIHFLQPDSSCLFQYILHIPCPGCGITSSVYAILSGNYIAAWNYNPCGFLVVAALLGQSIITALELSSILNSHARLTFALQSNTIVSIALLFFWGVEIFS